MKINNHLIGTDIELFFQRENGDVVSAEGFVPGTKHKPFVFDESNPYFSVSLDNVLAEFTIPPTNKKEDWLNSILKSMDYVNHLAKQADCVAVALPSARLASKYLKTLNARTFGCDSDYNVWERSVNPKPKAEKNLRSGGLHVHVGYEDPFFETNTEIIKALDLFLGVPSTLIEPENERRSLYGKAGTFRFKPYGVEYRTLSNFFVSDNGLIEWVYNNTEKAINFVNFREIDLEDYKNKIVAAIDNKNIIEAQNLINEFEIEMP